MSNNSSSSSSVNVNWLGLLGVILFVAKLLPANVNGYPNPVHDWSWWLVLLPFWFWLAFVLVVFLVGALGVAIYTFAIEPFVIKRRDRKRREALARRGRLGR